MFTPYSDDTGWTVDDFFERNQYFYNLEIGFGGLARTPTPIQGRGPMMMMPTTTISLYGTAMNFDDGKPEAHGIAFNANQKVGENAMWLGFALGWANPSNDLLDDQYTTEAFYRFHVTPALVHGSEIFRTRVFEAAVYAVVDMRRTDFGRAPKPVPGIPRDTHIDL
ncbi:hypothetical protein N8E89_28350 (plasmid) [Phyllobacterium sp. A18/5-2]|uniref:hypothetical protein n=1 Tax=Phyllobacterium sp. A18/5-2 TaxID=2978392 RepID=UPI0021C5B9F1|nr:hypothetical protein [Phyllobacterium sp. A18/5-2]UXN67439.1 hypothetical protein N8E89_28350 [Phyllobacterium sp. A18/5-2]